MNSFQKFIILISIGFGIALLYLILLSVNIQRQEVTINKERLLIEKEEHVDKLYSIYQNNITACISQARKGNKNKDYIVENCIKPVNESIIAIWLKDRGYENLLKTADEISE